MQLQVIVIVIEKAVIVIVINAMCLQLLNYLPLRRPNYKDKQMNIIGICISVKLVLKPLCCSPNNIGMQTH